MSPRKLSDSDRVKILDLYRSSEETTSTLATRYGVSSSTISRFLKSSLSELEYEDLIQEKRLARTPRSKEDSENESEDEKLSPENSLETKLEEPIKIEEEITQKNQELVIVEKKDNPETQNIKDNFKSVEKEDKITQEEQESDNQSLVTEESKIIDKSAVFLDEKEDLESINIIQAMFGEDIDDEDDDDDDDDDEDEDDDEIESKEIHNHEQVKVLPLSQASFPHICYLVIDRSSELITHPLKDFAELGNIPSEEIWQETLPVFDNHRVAKRFSNRRGKVIKVPDGKILHKTSNHLFAKGITRLLIDGKIYSL